MKKDGNATRAPRVLAELKAFQRQTAEYAFERLFKTNDSTRRFLVADEVGLGKTLVAAGVIGLAIDHLQANGTARVDIIYICSNQAIARQNVNRIKRLLGIETEPLASRITLLPYRLKTLDNPVNLIALTPGTSFNSASSEGVVEERIILYRMLLQTWGDLVRRSRRVFLGGLQSVSRFQDYERYYPARPIDPGIVKRFHESVGDSGSSMYEEFLELSAALNTNRNSTSRARRIRFIANVRRILARSCLDALEPDLVILDEFQRFRDLLDSNTESGELAQRLFEYEDSHTRVRTMLLSATPYKSDTLSHELDDDHCKDFLGTVGFLKGPEGSVEPLEESLRQFRAELPRVVADGEVEFEAAHRLSGHRDRIEAELGRVMSRTERRSGEVLGDSMLAVEDLPVGLETDDVESYLSARDISSAVYAPGIMEYWKSTPYLLSFAEQYRVYAGWLRDASRANATGDVDDAEHSVWGDLVANVQDGLADPSRLGRPPDDLVDMLAVLALGSPANATLRALSRITGLPTEGQGLEREAFTAAWDSARSSSLPLPKVSCATYTIPPCPSIREPMCKGYSRIQQREVCRQSWTSFSMCSGNQMAVSPTHQTWWLRCAKF